MLADLAVPPAYRTGPSYVETAGPEVAELCEMAGFIPDPEQRLALDMLFALNQQGMSAAFEFAIICARQNLKTGLLKMAALGWLFITDEELVVWSAHEFSTTREAHRDMVDLITGCPALEKRVMNIYDSSNDKSIHLKPPAGSRSKFGPRLVFKARTHSGGRGLSGNKVILDEALYLQKTHTGSLIPTLSAQPDPQVVYASSAGLAKSDVLRAVRDRGRKGISPRLGYLEYCAPVGGCQLNPCTHDVGVEGCALDKVENLQAANPLLGRRRANGTGMTLEYLQDERHAMTPSEYGRERLGWWDEEGADEVFGAGKWKLCGGDTPTVELLAVAVAVSVDLGHAAVVGVGRAGARIYVQVVAHGPGYDWVAGQVPAGVPVIFDPKGPAAVLKPSLKGLRRRELTPAQMLDAFDDFLSLVVDGDLLHDNDPILTRAADSAIPRLVGDRSTWARRKVSSEITAIEAATLAASWVHRAPPEQLPPTPPQRAAVTRPMNDLAVLGF